jgi:hypothetical protein
MLPFTAQPSGSGDAMVWIVTSCSSVLPGIAVLLELIDDMIGDGATDIPVDFVRNVASIVGGPS